LYLQTVYVDNLTPFKFHLVLKILTDSSCRLDYIWGSFLSLSYSVTNTCRFYFHLTCWYFS